MLPMVVYYRRPARRVRMALLVRRTRGRHHQDRGHMVGPFEVESALMEHPAVAEAGVIGKPDPVIGELVKAFVALKVGHEPSEALRMELLGFGRKKLGSAVARRRSSSSQPPENAQRKNHAAPAQGTRAGSARGRYFHVGERQMITESPSASTQPSTTREHALLLLRQMLLIRHFEEKSAELYTSRKSAVSCTSTSARKAWPLA